MFGYNAQFKRCAIDGAKTLRVQRLSATTGVNIGGHPITSPHYASFKKSRSGSRGPLLIIIVHKIIV